VCWLDTIGQALCESLYDPTIAAWAKNDHRTRTFGLGAGMAIGASVSGEAGVYYGESGEYGCYTSTCYGVVTDISVEVSGSFGDFQSLAALKADGGFDLSVGVGYGVAGYSQSWALDANGQQVGFVQGVSLGVGLSPIALGISTCDTNYMDLIAATPQPPPGETFYIVSGDGQLLRSHATSNGTLDLRNETIGTEWGGNTRVFAAGGGYVYLITGSGDLRYYHHDAAGNWDNGGTTIGIGWGGFAKVFASGFGRIYAVATNGDLFLYKHDAAGSFESPVKIGVGWNFPWIFSGGGNVVYAVDGDGRLWHYVHQVNGGWDVPQQIGTGWGGFAGLGSMGNGEIYAMTNNGTVLRYKHGPNLNWVTTGQVVATDYYIYSHGLIPAPH